MNRLLLVNFGGPRDSSEVEKFLLDLFLDPYTFDLPVFEFFRRRLGKFIAQRKVSKVREKYLSMGFGGGSPLVLETIRQKDALKEFLEKKSKKYWEVKIAMACGFPNLRDFSKEELIFSKKNIILPLFPHFSRSTTLSVAKAIEKITGISPIGRAGWIDPFYRDQRYVKACGDLICQFFRGNLKGNFLQVESEKPIPNWEDISLIFSAHGIPLRFIKKGDTYVNELKKNVEDLSVLLRNSGFRGEIFLSFQSRVGPLRWTKPDTSDLLREIGKKKQKRVAVYPISFVSDHLETLEEIGVQLREIALASGVEEYYRIPAPGVFPPLIDALGEIVIEASGD